MGIINRKMNKYGKILDNHEIFFYDNDKEKDI